MNSANDCRQPGVGTTRSVEVNSKLNRCVLDQSDAKNFLNDSGLSKNSNQADALAIVLENSDQVSQFFTSGKKFELETQHGSVQKPIAKLESIESGDEWQC